MAAVTVSQDLHSTGKPEDAACRSVCKPEHAACKNVCSRQRLLKVQAQSASLSFSVLPWSSCSSFWTAGLSAELTRLVGAKPERRSAVPLMRRMPAKGRVGRQLAGVEQTRCITSFRGHTVRMSFKGEGSSSTLIGGGGGDVPISCAPE